MKNNYKQDNKYTLEFSSILSKSSNVRIINHSEGDEYNVGISVADQDFQYLRVEQGFPEIIADLIDLAVAIHASDRLISQPLDEKQAYIHVVLPVRHPEKMNTHEFQAKLEDLLGWATGSRWSFDFQNRTAPERLTEQQQILPSVHRKREVILWSGGLDALAGLYTRLKSSSESFMLFGTGSSDNIYARQEDVFNALCPLFPNRLNLCRVPIRFSESNLHQKNKISRARGVVFALLGGACAYLMGQRILHVYENGIGAINLPYRKSAVGLDHSRSVHPLTLLKVSDTISELLEERFKVENPFQFWTKAEMCKTLAEDQKNDLVALTMSCDSPHRQQPIQCGYCSSCILRKQSLAASVLKDTTQYIVPHANPPAGDTTKHLNHMLAQISTLRGLLKSTNDPNVQWMALTQRFPELDDIVDRLATPGNIQPVDMQKNLIRLYQTYVAEWNTIESQILVEFPHQIIPQQSFHDCALAV
jgi:hypothetical protein